MLPPAARLRQRDEFAAVLRRGRRTTRGPLVVHFLTAPAGSAGEPAGSAPGESVGAGMSTDPARVGLVVGKGVGGAVRRNEVSRRLRHLMRPRLVRLPAGARLVIRALPGAAGQSSAALGHDLDAALERLTRSPR